MGLPLFKERRFSRREQLTGLIPGKLFVKNTKVDLIAKPVDVSENGIGVLLNQELSVGTKLVLQHGKSIYELEVQWTSPDFGKNDLFRYGLVCSDSSVNLIEVFRSAGCLKI